MVSVMTEIATKSTRVNGFNIISSWAFVVIAPLGVLVPLVLIVPSMVANLFTPNSSLGEKIKGAYMPSWVFLSLKAIEERVRKRTTKL
jgi:hypothetical protein